MLQQDADMVVQEQYSVLCGPPVKDTWPHWVGWALPAPPQLREQAGHLGLRGVPEATGTARADNDSWWAPGVLQLLPDKWLHR